MVLLIHRLRPVGHAVIATALTVVLASCGSGSASDGPGTPTEAEIPVLTVGVLAAPRSLDPAHSFDSTSMLVTAELFDTLLSVDHANTIGPRLAHSWQTPDPLTYVFSLREDVRFWDGTPVTAEDVAFSLRRHTDPAEASELASVFQAIASVSVTGPREVTVALSEPDPEFLGKVAGFGFVVKREHAERSGDTFGGSDALVMGSGPFQVTTYSAATGATLRRNETYWAARPTVQQLDVTVVTDPETMRLALQAGEIDATFLYPVDGSTQWDGGGIHLTGFDSPAVTALALDTTSAPLDDVHVRRAIAHAVNREAIISSLFGERARPAVSMVDPTLWEGLARKTGTDVDAIYDALPRYGFDLEAARRELASSRYPNGTRVTVSYPATTPMLGRIAQVIAQNLEQVGITLEIRELQQQEYLGAIYGGRAVGIVPVQLGAITPDPATLLTTLVDDTPFNIANYAPEGAGDALAANRGGTPPERVDTVSALMTAMARDVPYVPLYHAQGALVLSNDYVLAVEPSYWSLIFREWVSGIRAAE